MKRDLNKIKSDIFALVGSHGILSRFDLVKVCGISDYEIKLLLTSGNLTKIKRGCYEFTYMEVL